MITFDETKRLSNLAKHGIDFRDAEAAFVGVTITRTDSRDNYGEQRLQTLAIIGGTVVFIVHVPRGDSDHIISIRKAEKHEEKIYWQNALGR